jgi:hypothetical protein
MKHAGKLPEMSYACDRLEITKKGNNKWIKCVFTARVFSLAILLSAITVMSMTE